MPSGVICPEAARHCCSEAATSKADLRGGGGGVGRDGQLGGCCRVRADAFTWGVANTSIYSSCMLYHHLQLT